MAEIPKFGFGISVENFNFGRNSVSVKYWFRSFTITLSLSIHHHEMDWLDCVEVCVLLDNLGLAIYHKELQTLNSAMLAVVMLIDFVLYLSYSRRFYQHLKSREIEARLFKDRQSYLAERSIRRHFKVASILVAVAFSCFSISRILYPAITALNGIFTTFLNNSERSIMNQYRHEIAILGLIIYSLIYILNYLYLVTMIVGRFLLQKWRLTHINKKIKPIVRVYHNSLY